MNNYRKYIIPLILAIIVLPLILTSLRTRNYYNTSEHKFRNIQFEGLYSYNEKDWMSIPKNNKIPESNKNELYLKGAFSNKIPENTYIWFYTENIEVSFVVNGKKIPINGNEEGHKPPMFRSSGDVWYQLVSPGITPADDVSIHIWFMYDNSQHDIAAFLNSLYIGDGSGLYRMMLKNFNWLALAGLAEVIAGWIYMIEGLIYEASKMSDGKRILLMGFYFLTGGIWCLTDSIYPYLSFIVDPPWLASLIDMTGVLLLPLSLVLLVYYFVQIKAARNVMKSVLAITLLTTAAAVAIQLAGLADLYQQQVWIGSLGLIQIVIAVICVGIDINKTKSRDMKLLFLTLLPTLIAIAGEGVNGIYPFMPRRILVRYGFFISAVLMLLQFVNYAKADIKVKQELMESRISIMLAQIQPHFLYNVLESIGDLCTRHPARAEEAITDFSLFLRCNIESLASVSLVTFEQELSHTKHYLELEKVRFEERLRICFDTPVTLFRCLA